MRALVFILILGTAAPAAAYPYRAFEQARDARAGADAMAARNRDVQITNDLSVLQARQQSDETLSNLQAARIEPAAPTVAFNPNAPPPIIDVSKLASIPDAALAASNARVRAVVDSRR